MASRSGYVVQGRGTERGYALDRDQVVRSGRRREFLRLIGVAVGLAALQYPMRQVAVGRWSGPGVTAEQSAHLSLAIDLLFIVSYVYVARRALEMARAHRVSRGWRRLARVGCLLVGVGALLDLWEDVRLWETFSASHRSMSLSLHDAAPVFSFLPDADGLYSWSMRALVLVGISFLLLTVLQRTSRVPQPVRAGIAPAVDGSDVVICCSGGGIRATAFSLGGLQALQGHDIYHKASAVIGVSGGGYIAAAAHVLRWAPSDDESGEEWPNISRPAAFALDSPETAWVRRHTRYVLNSLGVATDAVLSLCFGIAVNLLLVTAALGGAAVVLAWLYLASGRLQPWPDPSQFSTTERAHIIHDGMNGAFADDWRLLAFTWVVPAFGVVLFLGTKVWDRFQTLSLEARRRVSGTGTWFLWVGLGLTVVVQVVPAVVAGLSHYTATSDSPLAALFFQLGLVPADVCQHVLTTQSACGASPQESVSAPSLTIVRSASFGTIVAAILAVLGSAKSAAMDKSAGNVVRRIWTRVKDPIVPWTALAVILLIGASVFLVWLTGVVQTFDEALIWKVAAVVGSLLVFAKVGTEPNRTSMHSFFRERISEAFLVRRGHNRIDPLGYRRPLRYSSSTPRDGGPRLVSCAVANVSDEELVPSKRGCTPFVFDHERIGLTDRLVPEVAGLRASAVYEFAADERYRVATIPAATAISAAAFSPLAGRESVRLGPYRAVLALGNARLGVWLPNPLWLDEAFLVRSLLRRRDYVEAASVWFRLPKSDQDYLHLRPSEVKRLKIGRHLTQIPQALRLLESALAAGDPAQVELARRRAESCLAAAHRTEPTLPPPGPGDLAEQLREALTSLTPSPRKPSLVLANLRDIFQKPGLTRLVKEAAGKASIYDRFLYVTDGGHYDNLGLVEALRRRPDHVIVLDASNDPEDTFRALGRAIATARMDLDCELTLDPREMLKGSGPWPRAAWCQGTYRFADDPTRVGRVMLAKAVMLDGLTWDLNAYADENADFPRTSTTKQLYSEFDFEAYRALGFEAVSRLLDSEDYKQNPIP